MNRCAILIANPVSFEEPNKSISKRIIKDIVDELSDYLENIGEYSFKTTRIIDKETLKARSEIRDALRKAQNSKSAVLLYYFGHGHISRSDNLFLFFKDSKESEEPTMLSFRDIVEMTASYSISQFVTVLDCCHAGAATKHLHWLSECRCRYYMMASVTPREKARVDYGGERPIGIFSKYFLDGFTSPDSRDRLTRNVTYNSIFNFIKKEMQSAAKQTPYYNDGGLSQDVFFAQITRPAIQRAFKGKIAKKSSYRKIYVICTFLLKKNYANYQALYQYVKNKRPPEFLTPIKSGARTVRYVVIRQHSFYKYLDLCKSLNIITKNKLVTLTARGRKMAIDKGRHYNGILYEILCEVWRNYGIKIADLEDIIATRIINNHLPTSDGIYRDLYLSKQLFMRTDIFRILLDLTGYVGALKFASSRTFFPPTERKIATG